MARLGETLFRFAGALLLAGAATVIDHPDVAKQGKRKPKPSMAVAVVSQGIGISAGKRSFGIRVAYDASFAFALRPNDKVDVVAVVESSSGESVAKLYMADMRLLGIATIREKGERPMVVASIEVTPEEADRLAMAATQASLRVVAHGSWDPTRARFDSALGAAVNACPPKEPAASVLNRVCPTRNPPPEFVAPRR